MTRSSRLILGIDPGPTACGVVLYRLDADRTGIVIEADKAMPVDDVLRLATAPPLRWDGSDLVAIERFQATGMGIGASSIETIRNMGRIEQAFRQAGDEVVLLYRREVLRALDVSGKGNRDKLVRERLIEAHGGSDEVAKGRKSNPGPLYGVSSHAWAALAVARVAGFA